MSISSFISDIKSKVFGNNNNKSNTILKVIPLLDDKFPDLEAGEGEFAQKITSRYSTVEMNCKIFNKIVYDDIDLNDKPIICGEVVVDINAFENCKIIENYVSFMDVINYLSIPSAQRKDLEFSNEKKQEEHTTSFYIALDISEGSLHLSSNNIM
jgi:hypothetical protein